MGNDSIVRTHALSDEAFASSLCSGMAGVSSGTVAIRPLQLSNLRYAGEHVAIDNEVEAQAPLRHVNIEDSGACPGEIQPQSQVQLRNLNANVTTARSGQDEP